MASLQVAGWDLVVVGEPGGQDSNKEIVGMILC